MKYTFICINILYFSYTTITPDLHNWYYIVVRRDDKHLSLKTEYLDFHSGYENAGNVLICVIHIVSNSNLFRGALPQFPA